LAADRERAPELRLLGIRTLEGLGGRSLYPDLYLALASDPDAMIRAAAK
jgi:hypothetical protein